MEPLSTLALRQRKAHLLRSLASPPDALHASFLERFLKCGRPNCRWMRVACEGLRGYPVEVVYQGGHRRWGIENQAFNELTRGYRPTHCYRHNPTSMLVQMLILIFAFALFTAFALHSQLERVGEVTRKAQAHQLDLAIKEDLPRELWFHSG